MRPHTSELEALLRRLSDEGRLSIEDRDALNGLLRGDVDACERYLNHAAIEAQLTREAAPKGSSGLPVDLKPSRSPKSRLGPWWLALGAAAALALVGWFALDSADRPGAEPLATLIFSDDADWALPHPEEGAGLPPGRYRLNAGLAVIRFRGGPELALTAPAELIMERGGEARLMQGRAFLRTVEGAGGFKMITRDGVVSDLGGEFSVHVQQKAGTRVCVLEGAASVRSASAGASSMVEDGQAVLLRANEASPAESTFDGTRFAGIIRRAAPRQRPDLMIAYDGFNYDAGRYAPEEIQRGKGWAGPWRLRTGDERPHEQPDETTDMHIVHGKLNVVWPVEGGRLGMLEMPPGKTYRVRPLKGGIDMGSDAVTYFSLMVHEPDHSDRLPRMRPQEGVRLTFRSSSHYDGPRLSFGLTARLHPQVQTGPGVGAVSAAEAPSKQTTLWVGKVLSRKNGEDEVSFRIYGEDDSLDYAEPGTWHVQTRGIRQDGILNLVVLTSEGLSARVIDEFRLGPTWRSVVPIQVLLTSR